MNDSFPTNLTIEIDRDRLRGYLRLSRILLWTLSLSSFGVLIGFGLVMDHIQRGSFTMIESIGVVAKWMGITIGTATLSGLTIYLLFNHHQSRRFAENLEVSVEGGFLRIRQGSGAISDRKIHFRSIVDYTTYQDKLMRCAGIQSLQMNTTGGGPGAIVTILGIKDCLKIRDMLSEIDRLRENQ